MKKVSIILPVYNGADTLEESLDSILIQTYSNWELIVVNDCSTDKTIQIVEDYCRRDNRISLVNNNENLKLPRSLNRGFSVATGEYLTWTSDDNVYLPNAIERMVSVLDAYSEFGMVYCNYSVMDEQGAILYERKLYEPEMIIYENIVGACFLYRREVAEKIGEYDPQMFLAEDYEYWIRVSQNFKMYHLRENLYHYREHPNNLTSTRAREVREVTATVYLKYLDYILQNQVSDYKYKLYNIFDCIRRNIKGGNRLCFKFIMYDRGYFLHIIKRDVKKVVFYVYDFVTNRK